MKKYKESDGSWNFNAIAYTGHEYDGEYGFKPSDRFYNEICEWLKGLDDVYREKVSENEWVVRKSIPNTIYDVMASYYPKTKMISYYFRKYNEFSI